MSSAENTPPTAVIPQVRSVKKTRVSRRVKIIGGVVAVVLVGTGVTAWQLQGRATDLRMGTLTAMSSQEWEGCNERRVDIAGFVGDVAGQVAVYTIRNAGPRTVTLTATDDARFEASTRTVDDLAYNAPATDTVESIAVPTGTQAVLQVPLDKHVGAGVGEALETVTVKASQLAVTSSVDLTLNPMVVWVPEGEDALAAITEACGA